MEQSKAICHSRREHFAAGKCLECVLQELSNRTPSKRYGATMQEIEDSLKEHDYKCAYCGLSFPRIGNGYVLEHCHRSGKFRSVSCSHCNSVIGFGYDSPKQLRTIATNLERIQKRMKHNE